MKAKIELFFIPAVFALTIFVQCVLFHYLIYKEILLSSLWHSPEDFVRFYLPAATIAVFFSSFVFLFKNKWWTVVVSLIFDVWIFANLWYYRANGILIDKYAVTMIGNLNGFWDSILALIRPTDFVFLILTIILLISIIVTNNRSNPLKITVFGIAISLIMGLANGLLLVRKYGNDWSYINPFKEYDINFGRNYLQEHTIIHHFAYTYLTKINNTREPFYNLSDNEKKRIENLINPHNDSVAKPRTPLIICIIESFNSFAIQQNIMPHLSEFLNNPHIMIAPYITSQAKGGMSADGQMMILSGLLPVTQGAACLRFPLNEYPAITKMYNNTAGLFPHDLDVWNQAIMNKAYSIKNSQTSNDNDKDLFFKTVQLTKESDFVMMLTASTHIPCVKYADSSSLDIPDTIPTLLKNYTKSVNVLDQGITILFDAVSSDPTLCNSTIVITGDHCLPIPADEDFGGNYGYSRFIPLIIYSPEIKQKTIITDTCYQMDIYPTILNLIGCEDYYWKGFGINLLDSAARHNRPITPEEAYDLSDKMIRADYFRKFEEQ
ncbi:MAG: sulfatase-like hydrolase/transferase [Bacteroidales bacterium]|nr:sulfatase-like hydrolase/transferase [Bacteroidales bacterium]